jgi:hypothetical protein
MYFLIAYLLIDLFWMTCEWTSVYKATLGATDDRAAVNVHYEERVADVLI